MESPIAPPARNALSMKRRPFLAVSVMTRRAVAKAAEDANVVLHVEQSKPAPEPVASTPVVRLGRPLGSRETLAGTTHGRAS